MHAPRAAPDENLDEYTQGSFRAAIASGTLVSGSQQVAYAFGKMSLTEFKNGVTTPSFDDLLNIVRQG